MRSRQVWHVKTVNLLVTNTRNSQAYSVIRALRPYAKKIVVTMIGQNRLAARLSHAANSRLVDERYYVPSPVEDWRAGKIQRENTEKEELYVQAVLQICEKENIDTIFPSFDPQVYVFSKNKTRFEKLGILIPVPDYEAVVIALDKYRTIQAAQETSFPCPKTYLLDGNNDLKAIAAEFGFPIVFKHRFTAAGRGFAIARDWSELRDKAEHLEGTNTYMIQEYIPGKEQQNWLLALDRQGTLKMALTSENVRSFYRLHANFPLARRALGPSPYLPQAAAFANRIGWWGGTAIQMKVDPRDGVPKLMEINPRIGEGRWQMVASGINEPLLTLKVARGEAVEAVESWPAGTMLLCPVEDLISLWIKLLDLLVYNVRAIFGAKRLRDPLNAPLGLKQLIASYKDTYLGSKKKVYNLYFTHFFSDPLVSLTWWLQTMSAVLRALREIGR
jgi:predicted ATP-grasp superfamily ATP-dependent carboligase